MNDNAEVPNRELREYVTSGAFVLTLSRAHIAMLTAVAQNNLESVHALKISITAATGLRRRGLLLHCSDVYGRGGMGHCTKYFPDGRYLKLQDYEAHHIYRLTKAGWAVYDLLVEAGLAQAIDRRSALRKRVA